jgi:pimeloyl-ACP methyl ester carboxylesterase
MKRSTLALCAALALSLPVFAQNTAPAAAPANSGVAAEPYGIALEGYPYPHPVHLLPINWEGRALRMAYMDVAAPNPNGKAVLLLHGRNFPGSYWAGTIDALTRAGYRVVVPDQIHFGKSSKPDDLPANFDVMAGHTLALLDHLKLAQVDVLAHSMGGMVGTRFTRSYPERVRKLVLEAPVGLEDYRQYVPLVPRERLIEQEMALTPEGYYRQLFSTYNPQLTREQFWPYVEVRARMMNSAEYPRWVRSYVASYYAMWGQPVVHEFPLVKQPTLIVVGAKDRTATGRGFAPPELREKMGNFPKLAREVAAKMPNARAEVFENNGHMLHLEAPDRFHTLVVNFLNQN